MDGQKTYRLEGFLPWDTASIIRHLEKMARRGWQLERVGGFFWTYRQAEPAALRYAVTYFPDAQFQGAFGEPAEDQAAYCDYCAAAGWQLVCCYGPQQVFVSRRTDDPVPIETDEGEKLTAIHRSVKKTLLLPLAVLLPLLLVLWPAWHDSARAAALSGVDRSLSLAWTALPLAAALCMLVVAADYLVWYGRSGGPWTGAGPVFPPVPGSGGWSSGSRRLPAPGTGCCCCGPRRRQGVSCTFWPWQGLRWCWWSGPGACCGC